MSNNSQKIWGENCGESNCMGSLKAERLTVPSTKYIANKVVLLALIFIHKKSN